MSPNSVDEFEESDETVEIDGEEWEVQYEVDDSSREEGYTYIRSNTSHGIAAAIEEVHTRDDPNGEWNCTPEDNLQVDEDASHDDPNKYTHVMILHEEEDPSEEE